MKKTIILILSLFFTFVLKAQDLSKIKNQNVFFIFFEQGELMKKRTLEMKNKNNLEVRKDYWYHFYNKDKEKFDFLFDYSDYHSFDDAYNKINKTMLFRVNKSFLRKNRDIIITRDFMEKVGEDAIIDLLFRGNKYIFLIDKSEIKDGKILLREVRFDYIPVDPEPIIKNIIEYKP